MNSGEILQVIDVIPRYIQYIFPGYLTIYLYLFFRSLTLKEDKGLIIKSIAISYIYKTIMDELVGPLLGSFAFLKFLLRYEYLFEILFLIFVSVLVSLSSYKVVDSRIFERLLVRFKIKTSINTNEIEQLEKESEESSIWVCVYLKNSDIVYEGYIVNKELEPEKRMFLCLSNFRKYQIDEEGKPKKPYIEKHDEEAQEKVIIYYQEILIIEKRTT